MVSPQRPDIDSVLLANVAAARTRWLEDYSPQRLEEYRRVLRRFADWVLRGRAPEALTDQF